MQSLSCSIIVCTYNRADSLNTTLKHLVQQDFKGGDLEILVIDNNSDDHTPQIAQQYESSDGVPVRYHFEPVQGISKARNTGVAISKADVLIFIDDDAYPVALDWAHRIVSAFADDSVGAAGGKAQPVWPQQGGRPDWLHDHLLPYLGIYDAGFSALSPLSYPNYPYGVNIAFRRSLLEEVGSFSEGVGRQGLVLLSGEETELCKRIDEAGHQVVFVPDAAVNHVMAPGRLTHEWFLRRAGFQGTSKVLIEWDTGALTRIKLVLKRLLILSGAVGATFLLRLLGNKPLAFVARCKWEMSKKYLAYALGAK